MGVSLAVVLGAGCHHRARARPAAAEETCLLGSPVDFAAEPSESVPVMYTNDLRLGMARGEAIFVSRPLCEVYGPALCRFVVAHERAHHHGRTVGIHSPCAEAVADCWAARHSDSAANAAAIAFFRGRRESSSYHAPPERRARIIEACAEAPSAATPMAAPPSATPGGAPRVSSKPANGYAVDPIPPSARDGS